MNTIELKQAEELAGVEGKKWNDRFYFNIPGSVSKVYWKGGKVYFNVGRGRNTSEANATLENLIGCPLIKRYSEKPDYVVVEA